MNIRHLASIATLIAAGVPSAGANTLGGSEIAMVARLQSPISSTTNRKNDQITAVVVSPKGFEGATLEGAIDEAKSSGDLRKTSTLRFSFRTLVQDGRAVPVKADLTSVHNSKGQPGVDEEGRVVKSTSNVKKKEIIHF